MINWPAPTYVGEKYSYNNKSWEWNGKAWVGISFQPNFIQELERLNQLIEEQNQKNNFNFNLISGLYDKILDLNEVINFIVDKHKKPVYSLCAKPTTEVAIVIKPRIRRSHTIFKAKNICKPELVNKSNMIWRNHWNTNRNEVPILGVGSFYSKVDRLVDNNGKDLCEYLPIHFNKKIDNILYVGIVGYEYIGSGYGKDSVAYQYNLKYQIYDISTTTTKIFDGSVFLWKKISDNKLTII